MDEEGKSRLGKLCVSLLLVFSAVQMLPFENPAIYNVNGGSVLAENDEGDFLEGTFEGVSVMGIGPSAELRLELNDTGRWIKMSPASCPNARRGHMLSSIYGTDKVLMFGGFDGTYYNDTWIYDLSEDVWLYMAPLGQQPGKRHSSAMAFISGTDKVLLFGGCNSLELLDNETWIYDFSNNNWARLKPPFSPDPREYHEMEAVYNDDKVVLFGGFDGTNYLDDTWVYDLSENLWIPGDPVQKPSPRKGHEMSTFYGTDKILFFGGNESGMMLKGDTWTYTHNSDEWNELSPISGAPIPRRGHGMGCFFETDQVLLFGPDEQTWIYDLSDNEWTIKPVTIQPSPRGVTHAMAPVFNDDRIVLFGGAYNDNGTLINYNDTWVYDLASYEQEGAYLSKAHDIGPDTLLKTIDWMGEIPLGTTVKLQIRSASSEPGLFSKDLVGPDGSSTSFYTIPSGETIWSGHQGDRWLQYKVYMSGTIEVSPTVSEVTINYNHLPDAPILSSPQNDVWTNDNTPNFEWNFLDYDSTQGGFRLLIDDDISFNGVDYDSEYVISGNEFWHFPEGTSYSGIPDGLWYWKVRTMDSDGDWGDYSSSYVLKIDILAPVSTLSTPLNGGFYSDLPIISGTVSDNGGSGVEKVQISIKRIIDDHYWTGTSWGPAKQWLETQKAEQWEFDSDSVTWESGNVYSVEVQSIDHAQNQEIQGPINSFTFDSEAPSISINPFLDGAYLMDLDTISGRSEDTGGSNVARIEISIKRDPDGLYWDGIQWIEGEQWVNAIGTNKWSYDSRDVLWQSDSSYSINARSIDGVGNEKSTEYASSFMIDSIAPGGLSILINNGDSFTKDPQVVLNLNAQDAGSGIEKMGFSSDGIAWSPWEDFKITRTYSLPSGDGLKNVYFRVKDRAGNVAEPVYARITLDTKEPPLDSDTDGVEDNSDAFPTDPSASVDSDTDGYPDFWNPGKSQGHSTTGLTLDEYPQDPTRHSLEIKGENDKETIYETIPFLIVPLFAVVLLVVFLILMKLYRNNGKNN